MARKIPEVIQAQVRRRANNLCEYCHTDEHWQYVPFTIDHLKAVSDGGEDDPENLALACFHCYRRKSNKRSAIDRDSGQTVPLFHPRHHIWAEHFIWSADGLRILPLTAIGRATVDALELNRERILRIRAADVGINRYPPEGDSIRNHST